MPLPDFAEVVPVLRSAQDRGYTGVVVTVIANRSSAAVRPSERVLVRGDGSVTPDLPGIASDRVSADALTCLVKGRSRLLSYDLLEGMLVPAAAQRGEIDLYFEVLAPPPRLIVVGGGHIAVPLVRIADVAGYEVTVLDDRAEYADPQRFPEARHVVHGPYHETLSRQRIDSNAYVVLVTRGHVHDTACLELIKDSPAAYIGMIGSKTRVKTVLDHVFGPNPTAEAAPRLYAPIGLDLGGVTPEEIAVAIVAELVKVRRGGTSPSLSIWGNTDV